MTGINLVRITTKGYSLAHFYGTTQGNRGEATRCGSKSSGLVSSVNGWEIGGTIEISHDKDNDRDEVEIYITSGSGNGSSLYVGKFYKDQYGEITKENK